MADEKRPRGRPIRGTAKRVIQSIKLEPDFKQRADRTAFWTGRTVTEMIEEGLSIVIKRLEEERNGGKPFGPTTKEGE